MGQHDFEIDIQKFDLNLDFEDVANFNDQTKSKSLTSIVFTVPNEKYFSPEEKKQKEKSFFKFLQWKLIGPYMCYRQ